MRLNNLCNPEIRGLYLILTCVDLTPLHARVLTSD